MQYTSPLALLDIDPSKGNVDVSTINFNLLKKKYLAEFELTNAVTISTPMGEMSKNDIMKFFDSMQGTDNLKYHFEILKHANLSMFLQKNRLIGPIKKDSPIFDDPEFIAFITPYVQHSYNTVVCELLDTPASSNSHISNIPSLVNCELNYDFYKSIRETLTRKIFQIEAWISSVEKSKKSVMEGELKKIFGFHTVRVLNTVNQTVFEPEIFAFMRISHLLLEAYINHKTSRFENEPAVKHILSIMKQINACPPEIKERINEFTRYFNKTEEHSESGGSDSSFFTTIRIIGLIVFIISILLRACHI